MEVIVDEHISDQVERIRALPSPNIDADVGIACDAATWLMEVLANQVRWKDSLVRYSTADLALEYSGITAVRHALSNTGDSVAPSICGGLDVLLGMLSGEALRRGLILAADKHPDLERRALIAALHICLDRGEAAEHVAGNRGEIQ